MLQLLILGFKGKRENVFDSPPFSKVSTNVKKGFKLTKNDLLEEVKRRSNILLQRHQQYPETLKKVFYDTRGAFPAPSQWKVKDCMEWLLDPMHNVVTEADTAFLIKTFDAYKQLLIQAQEEEANTAVTEQIDPWKRAGYGSLYVLICLIHC